jgi:hypothetical protein
MTQFENSAAGTFVTDVASQFSRYTLISIGTIVLIGAIAVTVVIAFQADGSRLPGRPRPHRCQEPRARRHLRTTVHTGTFCSYTPDPRAPITWEP